MYITDPLHFVPTFLFIFVLSVVTALFEIQIEGANGWAEKLPTWRYAPAWIHRYFNLTELTGYHVYLTCVLLLLFHFPMVLTGWSMYAELTALSGYFAFNVIWDFLWFVLNPAYGWCRYEKNSIWWFQKWVGSFPLNYYSAMTVSLLFAVMRGLTPEAAGNELFGSLAIPLQHAIGWLIGVGFNIGFITYIIRRHGKCKLPNIPDHSMSPVITMPAHGK